MKTIAIVTEISPLLLSVLYAERRERPISVYTTNDTVASLLKQAKLSPIMLAPNAEFDWRENDLSFYDRFMGDQGCLKGSLPFVKGDLKLWKVLGLDRLYFWYGGRTIDQVKEFVGAVGADRIITSMDFQSPVAWGWSCKDYVGVQTSSLMGRIALDLAPILPFTKVLVNGAAEKKVLAAGGYTGEIVVCGFPGVGVGEIDLEKKKSFRKGMSISDDAFVYFVLYDPQTEWSFRRWLDKRLEKYNGEIVLVYCKNSRVQEVCINTSMDKLSRLKYQFVHSMDAHVAADKIILFRFDEGLIAGKQAPVEAMDVSDRFDSNRISAIVGEPNTN